MAAEERREQRAREEKKEQLRKLALRRMQDFEKKQLQEYKEEHKWCVSLAIQQNNNSRYKHGQSSMDLTQ